MSKLPVMVISSAGDLEPGSISADWILSGTPETRSKTLIRSHDWMSHLVLWECTAGQFKWHYSTDEVLIVVSGEAYMMEEGGGERRFGPGDIGYFPAGSSCIWRVPDSIRKVAVIRETTWRPLGFFLKACNKLLRIAGLKGKSALMLAVWVLWNIQ